LRHIYAPQLFSLSTIIRHDPSDSYRYDQDDTLWDRYVTVDMRLSVEIRTVVSNLNLEFS
ncbi:unnamed protein product, partial [Rotaria magnacalcarata]